MRKRVRFLQLGSDSLPSLYGLCVAGDRVAEDRGIRELLGVRREEEHLCVRAPRHRRQGRHVLAVEQESSSVAPRRRAAVGRRAAGSAAFERRSDPVERVGEASRLDASWTCHGRISRGECVGWPVLSASICSRSCSPLAPSTVA